MLPTRTTVLLFALTLLGLPLCVFVPAVYGLVLGAGSGLFLLLGIDALLASRLRLQVRRERPARLSLGVDNEVVVVLENPGRHFLRVLVRDEPPHAFRAAPTLLEAVVPPHGWARLCYQLLPSARGNFTFGNIGLRLRGPWGLAWLDRTVPASEPVQVYPNLLEVRRYEALVRTTLVRTGGYRSRRLPGAGREFSHYRDYSTDDDYRHVNWKATARRGKPITAVFESEHSQDIVFCLDIGRMMAARVGTLTKLDHAINAVLMLTHVSQTFQDNLGLLVFSHTVHLYLPPAKGRAQHARFLQALYSVQPERCYVNYREAFEYLVTRHPKRALVMVFTDLLDAVVSAEYRDAVRLLQQFHLPLTLAVADVPLQNLAGQVPQTPEQLYDILVARALLQGRAELLQSLERQGVLVLDTVPERLTVDAVNRYLALKTGSRM
ncbi:MAG: DUF58 domain-containing protein [Gemmataceae bacterium]|nr:DUF58 domain-containing protein [Gemmataceae bacterium]